MSFVLAVAAFVLLFFSIDEHGADLANTLLLICILYQLIIMRSDLHILVSSLPYL